MSMTQENLENLTQHACFAADGVAMDVRNTGVPEVQVTRAVVARVIEFLVGNGLVEFKKDGTEEWLSIDPPYPHWPADTDSDK